MEKCGKIRVREGSDTSDDRKIYIASGQRGGIFTTGEKQIFRTTGWRPGCECGGDPVPCVVLDPFGGAGTTALVADRLGRDAILIELNREYVELARQRIEGPAPLLAKVKVE